MALLIKNNAYSALAAALASNGTSLTVTTGTGDRFPIVTGTDFFKITLQDASNNIEIIKVTARAAASDSMTIVRAQEGTTARAWNIGDVAELRVTAAQYAPLQVMAEASTAADIRTAIDTPSTAGAGATGTWGINVTGNAGTATALQNARTINGVSFNGTANIDVNLNTSLTFNNAGTGGASGSTFNGGTALTVSYNTVGAPSTTGTNASGTWGINITGNAATVTNGVYNNGGTYGINITGNAASATNATSAGQLAVPDTRASVQGPDTGGAKVRFDFVQNSTDGLNDGASYHGVMTFQQYQYGAGGGGTRQLGFTDNDNLWIRGSGNGAASYGPWKLFLNSTNFNSYAPTLTGGGASGTWGINITGNAGSAYGLAVQGAGSAPGANQVLRSDGNGYTYHNYINSNTGNGENPSISQVIVTNGSDNFYRKASLAHLGNSLNAAGYQDVVQTGGSAPYYGARAWVNFNGTGTVAIRAAGNVSSITDNGVGLYAVNFTNALPDANYSIQVCASTQGSTALADSRITTPSNPVSASQANVTTQLSAVGAVDLSAVCVAIFR